MFVTKLLLLVLAFAVGFGVVAGEGALYSALTERPWTLSHDLEVWNVAIVAVPFIVLALLSVRRVIPWAAALTLTLLVWGWRLYDTVNYHQHPDGSGANIGLGIVLFTSPFVIAILVAAVHFARGNASMRA